MIRKWRNQKEIPTPQTTKTTSRYLYQENVSQAERAAIPPKDL